MSQQDTLSDAAESEESSYYIFYREIQADDNDLTEDAFTGNAADNVNALLDDVFTNASGDHTLDELDTTRYFDRWVEGALTASEQLAAGAELDERIMQNVEDLAENFSASMQTRARAEGKYVVIILGNERLIACHSYTGSGRSPPTWRSSSSC